MIINTVYQVLFTHSAKTRKWITNHSNKIEKQTELRSVQTENVWRPNIIKHCLVTKKSLSEAVNDWLFFREQNIHDLEQAKSISRKAKFLDSYEKRLANEFKLTLLYAGNVQVFLRGATWAPGANPRRADGSKFLVSCLVFLGVSYMVHIYQSKCFFSIS